MNITATFARTKPVDGSHWYGRDGTPMYTVIAKSTGQSRPTTLADARKLWLLPSVTTILKILHKQALVDWLIEQACLAVLTTPRKDDEALDGFVHRVLHQERVQDEESAAARELGTDIHAGLEALFKGERIEDELRPWIEPAYLFLKNRAEWNRIELEQTVVGDGYAGKVDWQGESGDPAIRLVVDFKTTKKLPEKGSWQEHRLQLAGYGAAIRLKSTSLIQTANLYISTVEVGKFVFWENPPWEIDYEDGFAHLVKLWQWQTGYCP